MRAPLIWLTILAGLAFLAPAAAQTVYLEGPGASVGIGTGYYRSQGSYYIYDEERPRYRPYYPDGYRAYGSAGCRTITIERDDGSVRRIRRCG